MDPIIHARIFRICTGKLNAMVDVLTVMCIITRRVCLCTDHKVHYYGGCVCVGTVVRVRRCTTSNGVNTSTGKIANNSLYKWMNRKTFIGARTHKHFKKKIEKRKKIPFWRSSHCAHTHRTHFPAINSYFTIWLYELAGQFQRLTARPNKVLSVLVRGDFIPLDICDSKHKVKI